MAVEPVKIGEVEFGPDAPLAVIAGPCQLESRAHALEMAHALKEIAARVGIGLVFKSSFDKANRTSATSARGMGLHAGLKVLADIRSIAPTLTDVHETWQCAVAARAVDCLQIPAMLCRQTDLLAAAAETGRVVNIKKSQSLAPWDMEHVVKKLRCGGRVRVTNPADPEQYVFLGRERACSVLLTERGTSFGYNTLVNDMRALPIMAKFAPVIFDATHSVQQPGGLGDRSGGQREFVPMLARAAVATGSVSGVFIECHQDPDNAPSDGPNMIALKDMERLLRELKAFDQLRWDLEAA